MQHIQLSLPTETIPFSIMQTEQLESLKNELETFLENEKQLKSIIFAKKVLFTHELKANNTIEGYNDDVGLVNLVIKDLEHTIDPMKRKRIMNLYKGYQYILQSLPIDKEHLKELYDILKDGILEENDIKHMGNFYRNGDVDIFYSSFVHIKPDRGVNVNNIEPFMDALFDFVANYKTDNTETDHFIKSQIIHFYFVYIHPYFDINGRTSRTMSIWYLLNEQIYPYIIFNRAISLAKPEYYKVIREAKKYHNIGYFLSYMLEGVKLELEKEIVMQQIASNVTTKLTSTDYQTIHYLLSMKGLKTTNDFTTFYNRFNDRKKPYTVYHEMLEPLIERGVIYPVRQTTKFSYGTTPNQVYEFNPNFYELDPKKIKYLKI